MKRVMKISAIGIVVFLMSYFLWNAGNAQSLAQPEINSSGFKGKILAASDADMLATAYADGILNKIEGIEDTLSLIEVVGGKAHIVSRQIATNSVVSWPAVIEWNKDEKLAYVAETRGIHTGPGQQVKNVWEDLPKGSKITVIDYQNLNSPRLIQKTELGENIQGVSINSEANLLAAGSTEKGKEIIIAILNSGKLAKTYYFTADEISQAPDNNSGILTIVFHPSQNIIAANLNNTHLVFYKVNLISSKVSIEQIGSSIEVAKRWSVGNWHPSGKYFILTDVAWGDGTMGAIFNGKGKLVSVRFDEKGNHNIASSTKVGLSPEGFDISPNGKYAIVANMRRTYGPKKFWFVPARKNSSLSLVKIDANTGRLRTLGKQYGFEGALPEDAVFDIESNSIAVAVFHKQDEEFPTQGWIDFWELENDKLIKTSQRQMLTRGVHNLLLIE